MTGLKRPCDSCPFRADIEPFLRKDRAEEIADALRAGGMFACHKTTEHDDDGDHVKTSDEEWCVGALLVMSHDGGAEANQLVRIFQRVGALGDIDDLEGHEIVFKSFDEWIEAQE